MKFEKGEKRVEYDSKLHPQWEYITNLMLTHNSKKRPTFHDILELLKKLDDNGTMRQEIQNKKEGKESKGSLAAIKAQNYLSFIEQKYDVLANLESVLIEDKYKSLSPLYKNILIFLALARYVTHVKKLIRSLKYKTLKFPNDEDVVDRNNEDNSVLLLVDKYRNSFEAKSTKFTNHLKEKIIPKIVTDGEKEKMKNIEDAFKMVKEAESGSFDVEDSYEEAYLLLLDKFKYKPSVEKIKEMSIDDQGIYLYILMTGFLNHEFPNDSFMKKNFVKNKVKEYSHLDEENMMATIKRLRE